jgi:group I intron endonuclease
MPYVYKLTHKLTGQFYIGYRHANKLPSDQDLPIYQSSSKVVKSLGFHNFEYEILAEFFDAESANDYENHLIEMNHIDPLILNRRYTRRGNHRFIFMRKHTEETKQKLSLANKGQGVGRKHTEETKQKMSLSKIGKKYLFKRKNREVTDELRKNLSLAGKRWMASIDARNKLRISSPNRIPVTIDGVEFDSIRHAASILRCSRRKIKKLISALPQELGPSNFSLES